LPRSSSALRNGAIGVTYLCVAAQQASVINELIARPAAVIDRDRLVLFVVVAGLTGYVQPPIDIADFEHFAPANHLGASQSNDATRIFPPTSRLNTSVVLSVVPNFSSTFSVMTAPETL
jgi:hypothetical protein